MPSASCPLLVVRADGALDLDLFGGHDVDVGGGHDIGDAGGHDAGGHDAGGHDADGDADSGGIWHTLGLGDVPITISASIIVLVAWVASLCLMTYVVTAFAMPGWVAGILLPLVLLLALPVTAILVRPLRPVFAIKEGKSNADYVGHMCTINTGTSTTASGKRRSRMAAPCSSSPCAATRPASSRAVTRR